MLQSIRVYSALFLSVTAGPSVFVKFTQVGQVGQIKKNFCLLCLSFICQKDLCFRKGIFNAADVPWLAVSRVLFILATAVIISNQTFVTLSVKNTKFAVTQHQPYLYLRICDIYEL